MKIKLNKTKIKLAKPKVKKKKGKTYTPKSIRKVA
jgi:hypothetical protein